MLPTGDPLGTVVTMLATPFGRLDGLAIDTAGAGGWLPTGSPPDSPSKGVIDGLLGPIRNSAPFLIIWRAPLASGFSLSRSLRVTQERLLLRLVPREHAASPDLLPCFDRGGSAPKKRTSTFGWPN